MSTAITDYNQLSKYLKKIINSNLLDALGRDIKSIFEKVLNDSMVQDSSMETWADYVYYVVRGSSCSIYIDYAKMSSAEASEAEFGVGGRIDEWGRFTNTFDGSRGTQGSDSWDGKLITFELARWLQGDGLRFGGFMLGNQPLGVNKWFSRVYQQVESQLPSLVRTHLQRMGFEVIN